MIKICTGDSRFVNDQGGMPGLWIPVRRCQRDRKNWNRLARALVAASQLAPPLMPLARQVNQDGPGPQACAGPGAGRNLWSWWGVPSLVGVPSVDGRFP